MSKECTSPEKNIELHHPAIEEIMGAPPANLITVVSGLIFCIVLGLFTGSFFFTYPDVVQATAIIHGDNPLEVITAPESGKISISVFSGESVKNNDTIFGIYNLKTKENFPVMAEVSGILEVNPLITMQQNARQNDTIGFIWEEKTTPYFCSIHLSPEQRKNIMKGNKIQLHVMMHDSNQDEIIETNIQSINTFNTGNKSHVIAVLPDHFNENRTIRGELCVPAKIIVGEQSFFQRLINPFRGLIR